MSKKPYTPKKKRYNDLCTLSREMTAAKIKHAFNGCTVSYTHLTLPTSDLV